MARELGVEVLSNVITQKSKKAFFHALHEQNMQAGWLDYMGSAPFPASYDDMGMIEQLRYELGRRCAAIYVARWKRKKKLKYVNDYLQDIDGKYLTECGRESRF